MSVIRIKLNQPFTAVPNHLVNNPDISANALAAITYLAGKPEGWVTRSYDVKKRFKWGDYTWRQVSLELRALGLLSDVAHPDGKQLIFELHWDEVDKAVDKVCEPPVDFQQVQKPTVGNQRIYKERYTKKDLLKKNNYEATNFEKKEEQVPLKQIESKVPLAEKKKIMQDMALLLKQTTLKPRR